jgi:hypothetical protein
VKEVWADTINQKYLYESTLWRLLSHKNLVAFYGLNINKGVIELVSMWMENGDAMKYTAAQPNSDRCKIVGWFSTALGRSLTLLIG